MQEQAARATDGEAGFFSVEVRKMSIPDRRELLVREGSGLSLRQQCALLGLSRSAVYRKPQAATRDAA
ncbi:hypothetical protein AA12717_0502 [Gluconacetobacter sacchari DSM 12717]|uniref:Uncharacterized protein n=2 Tax=Gluconacetobacter sacchari TaxID=92759 RepID=A0A7W4NQH6_9PROT|nr:hypothetical protein [Gluconacetobacter sacchari]MBB2162521.1 hypothetical protein [Gluconacetobacter sacchari]GBQ20223.1 hypothetical protein AA12717_0502 [Gluconacetobacter sacchari DSM 12717]